MAPEPLRQTLLAARRLSWPKTPFGGDRTGAAGAQATLDQLAKRGVDLSCAMLALLFLAPLFCLLVVLIRAHDGGPALFRQTRVGRGGRRFTCYKFRSMALDAEAALQKHLAENPAAAREWASSQKLTHDPRITPLGSFLRTSSLDELPQIYNVLIGDMSLVGPRPIVPNECPRYGRDLEAYTSVRPGITGLWQISGRSDCSYPERVALDVQYVREQSLARDVTIILRTVPAVLTQRGSR